MKIAFVYGMWASANHRFDFQNDKIFTDSYGLTGSEMSCFTIASGLADRGHDIILFTGLQPNNAGIHWRGVKLSPIEDFAGIEWDSWADWDAVYSWNEVDILRPVNWKTLRIVNLQINDFGYNQPDFDNYIDAWTSPSESHRVTVGSKAPHPEKFSVITNGCDPTLYDPSKTVNGRVIWASSPDRGLHHLLSIWPSIKKAVPHAHLKIFYRIKNWLDYCTTVTITSDNLVQHEFINRALYIKEALRRFEQVGGLDVEFCDAVSRVQMIKEMSEAQVLAYPCDPPIYTEGFSVTIMEACASGTVPVITDADALGSIYGGCVPMVHAPVGNRIGEYKDLLISTLNDATFREQWTPKGLELANKYTWNSVIDNVENLISEKSKRGKL
jgi:glycosyltransferase involved in cell wall biosynthesis